LRETRGWSRPVLVKKIQEEGYKGTWNVGVLQRIETSGRRVEDMLIQALAKTLGVSVNTFHDCL
jgi:ribosome-binding protein aMBF1 (putative translation factor)